MKGRSSGLLLAVFGILFFALLFSNESRSTPPPPPSPPDPPSFTNFVAKVAVEATFFVHGVSYAKYKSYDDGYLFFAWIDNGGGQNPCYSTNLLSGWTIINDLKVDSEDQTSLRIEHYRVLVRP